MMETLLKKNNRLLKIVKTVPHSQILEKLNIFQKNKSVRIGAFILVLVFTFILRGHNYDRTPGIGHLEEMMYAWSGMYLIETGVPVAWSTLDYPDRAEVYRGKIDYNGTPPNVFVRLYKPWLDEPPLFSLLVGGVAHLYHADRMHIIPPAFIRLPMIFIATLTGLMIFLIMKSISGFWSGLFAELLYGTIPLFVLASRMAVAENLVALFFITTIYLLIRYQQNPKFLYILSLPLLFGLAGLSKPTGFLILPLAVFVTLLMKNYKHALYLILATLPFVGLFIGYGYHFDKEIFWTITTTQSTRPVGFGNLAWFLVSPAFDITLFVDSWYVLCLVSAVYFLLQKTNKMQRFIAFCFVYGVVMFMLSGGETDLLPWYRYHVFPLLAIMGTWGIYILIEKADFFTSVLAEGFFLGNRYMLVNAFRPQIHSFEFRIMFSTLLIPSLSLELFKKHWLLPISRLFIVGMLVSGMYLNTVYIYNIFEFSCESLSCPYGPLTKLSQIYFPVVWRFFVLGPAR